jgi:hypothetical protein
MSTMGELESLFDTRYSRDYLLDRCRGIDHYGYGQNLCWGILYSQRSHRWLSGVSSVSKLILAHLPSRLNK